MRTEQETAGHALWVASSAVGGAVLLYLGALWLLRMFWL